MTQNTPIGLNDLDRETAIAQRQQNARERGQQMNQRPSLYDLAFQQGAPGDYRSAHSAPTPAPAGRQGFVGDAVDALQMGLAQATGGLAETAHQITGSETMGKASQAFNNLAKSQIEQMSEAGQAAMQKQFFTEDENGSINFGDGWTDPRAMSLQFMTLIGQMGAQIPLGYGIGTVGAKAAGTIINRAAARHAAGRGMSEEAVKHYAQNVTRATFGTSGQALAGAGIAGGMIGNEARDTVMEMSDTELDQSPAFVNTYWDMVQTHPDLDVAQRRDLAKKTVADGVAAAVQRDPMLITTNLVLDAAGGYFIDRILRGVGTGSRLSNAGQQFVAQGLTEMGQGGMEQYALNTAMIEQDVDPDRDPLQGVAVNALNEGTLGGGMGLMMGAARKGKPSENKLPARIQQEDEEGRVMQPIQTDPDVMAQVQPAPAMSLDEAVEQIKAERGQYRGIDDDIRIAEEQGFTDEAVRLRAAKRNFEMAADLIAEGDIASAERFRERGNKIYRDLMEVTDPQYKGGLPAEYVAVGEMVERAGQFPAQAQPQGETVDGQATRVVPPTPALQHSTKGIPASVDAPYYMPVTPEEQAMREAAELKRSTSRQMTEDAFTEQQGAQPPVRQPLPVVEELPGELQEIELGDTPPPVGDVEEMELAMPPVVSDEITDADKDAIRKYKLPKNLNDGRLLRSSHRGRLEVMASELTPGGGIAILPDKSRTSSLNPDWFQNAPENVKRIGVKGMQVAVKRALRGENIGKAEARAVQYLLDVITEQRNDYARTDARPAREQQVNFRKVLRGELSPQEAGFVDSVTMPQVRRTYSDDVMRMAGIMAEQRFTDGSYPGAENDGIARALADDIGAALDAGVPLETIEALDRYYGDDPFNFGVMTMIFAEDAKNGKDVTPQRVESLRNRSRLADESANAGDFSWLGQEPEQPKRTKQEPESEEILTSYTEQDIAQRQQAAANREKAELTQQQKAASKAKADSEALDFTLSGSDRPADVAASRGQSSLFDTGGKSAPKDSEATQTPASAGVSVSEAPIRNSTGRPFKDIGAARIALKKNPGYEIAKVDVGYELQRIPEGAAVARNGNMAEPPRTGALDMNDDLAGEIDAAANEAATSPLNDKPEPTAAQIEAGNYEKGHVTVHGLDIAIENPRGSQRSGTDPNGKKWSVTMAHHYGYLKKTEGADGEHIDVYLGKNPESEKVFIVDQVNADGSFDEHKVMLGFTDRAKAITGYKANYEKGWKVGPVTELTMQQFKDWIATGDTEKPLSGSLSKSTDKKGSQSKKPESDKQAKPLTSNPVKASTEGSKLDAAADKLSAMKREKAAALAEMLKKRAGRLNSGIDPEVMIAMAELGAITIAQGTVKFAQWARDIIREMRAFGVSEEEVKPFLKQAYGAITNDPERFGVDEADADLMDNAKTVRNTDVNSINLQDTDDDLYTPGSAESDSENGADTEQAASGSNEVERSGEGGRRSEEAGSSSGKWDAGLGESVDGRGAPSAGERSDSSVRKSKSGVVPSAPGNTDYPGSGESGTGRLFAEREGAAEVGRVSAAAAPEVASPSLGKQSKEVTSGSEQQIAERMPFLDKGQVGDVAFVENRLSKPEGYGALLTNGTGTGKTFSGLGIVRRFMDQGKNNVLIVTPSRAINNAWVKAGGKFFGIQVNELPDTASAGKGVVVTTFANFGSNSALFSRQWDLIVLDEAHKLSQNQEGETTASLRALRGLAMKPGSEYTRMDALYSDLKEKIASVSNEIDVNNKSSDDRYRALNPALERELEQLNQEWKDKLQEQRDLIAEMQKENAPRALMLSATPFSYEKNVQLGEGFLFDWGTDKDGSGAYNSGGNYERFMMQHFGYRMRYNKLTQPDAKVDTSLMQRNFNSWLKQQGVLRGRVLETDFDYDRKFILTESAIGRRVDAAFKWLSDHENKYAREMLDQLRERFDYHSRMYFLEGIKAIEAVPIIRKNLELGRKVLIMHGFKKGGMINPFRLNAKTDSDEAVSLAAEYMDTFSDLIDAHDNIPSAINTLKRAFPDLLIYNGDVPPAERLKLQDRFNDDNDNAPMLAQGAAMREGVSIHDTTGNRQRVLIHLGMPSEPSATIQQEGRIYRVGQASDAIFRYMTIGTNWERHAFASRIASRASTAENLAMGELARGLKEAFIEAYEQADYVEPGQSGEGTGGKAADRAKANLLTDWDKATAYYYGTKKQGSGRSSRGREGKDYFATPEPVGLKMVEMANIMPGDSVLEPSAGHGAIGRWFPENSESTAIEPSDELSSVLALRFPGKILQDTFENHYIGNKYNAIVMNPPYGSGGKTAADHVGKAMKHLRNQGRIVALIPTGPAADKQFEKLLSSEEATDVYEIASIAMPTVTFERAGTSIPTRIIVLEKQTDKELAAKLPSVMRDYSRAETITDLFDRIKDMEIPGRTITVEEPEAGTAGAKVSTAGVSVHTMDSTHSQKGHPLFVVNIEGDLADNFEAMRDKAKANNGFYIAAKMRAYYKPNDGVKVPGNPTFNFSTEQDRTNFLASIAEDSESLQDSAAEVLYSLPRDNDPDLQKAIADRLKEMAQIAKEKGPSNPVDRSDTPPMAEYVRKWIAGVEDDLGVKIEVVETKHDLPESVKADLGSAFNDVEFEGFYNTVTGRTYLIASHLTSRAAAVRAALHEALGHGAVINFIEAQRENGGKALDQVLDDIYQRIGKKLLMKKIQRYNLDLSKERDRRDAVLEYIAHVAEEGKQMGLVRRVVAALRDLIRKVYPGIGWNDTDTMALIAKSKLHLQQEGTRGVVASRGFVMKQSDETQKRFENRIDALFSGSPASRQGVRILDGADILALLGFDEKPLHLVESAVGKKEFGQIKHPGMTAEQWKKLPDWIENPAAVFKSQTQPGSLVLFAPEVVNGRPVRIILKPNAQAAGLDVHLAINAYEEGGSHITPVDKWVKNGDLLYLDEKQSPELNARSGLRLPRDVRQLRGPKTRVLIDRDLVNYRNQKGDSVRGLFRLSDALANDASLTDDQKAALSKIGPKSAAQTAMDRVRDTMTNWRLKVRQGLVDRYAGLLELDKQLLDGNVTSEENITKSAWVKARMSNAAGGAVSAMMNAGRIVLDADGVIDVKKDTSGLIYTLNQLGSAAEVERFMGWIAGNRGEKLMAEGRENLFTPEDIAALKDLNTGAMPDGRDRNTTYEKVFAEFQQHRDDVLAIAEKAGIITRENREMWANEFYVPFYRLDEEAEQAQGPRVGGGLSRQQAYKKLKGGTQNLNDLLQNTIMNFHHLLDASLKNMAATQAVDNALELGVVEQTTEATRDKKQSTFVLRNGEKVWYDVADPLVFQALTSLNPTGMNSTAMKVMRWFKRTFTNLTTSTPQFIVANLIRDSLSAISVVDMKYNAASNVVQGLKSFGITDRTGYQRARLMASGGAFSFGHAYGEDAEFIRYQIDGEMRRGKILTDPKALLGHGLKPFQAAWDRWKDVNNSFENANRMAAFEQAEAAGKGKLYAAFQARDLMDFSASGAWPAVRFLIDVVPFLNARLQGLDKLYRSGVKPTGKVVMQMLGVGSIETSVTERQAAARFSAVVAALSLATMALYLRNQDDEDYQKAEDWMKDTYWWIRIPGTEHVGLIPKPFEVGAIATLTERLLEQAVDDKATGKLFRERLGFMLEQTFSFSPVPQMLQPAFDVYSNKDSFTGRDIETMGQQRLSPSNRANDRTTMVAQWMSNGLEAVAGPDSTLALSPVQIDYLISGYFGQMGAWAVGHTDVLKRALSDNDAPARHWYEYQPIRRFYRNMNDPQADKQTTLFYESLRDAARLHADVQQLKAEGNYAEAAELQRKNQDVLAGRLTLDRVNRKVSAISARIKAVKANQALSADEKRRQIDLLQMRKKQLIEQVMPAVEKSRQ